MPEVRDRFPPVSEAGRRGIANGHRNGKRPRPTTAKPGTREKLEVMAWRVDNGYALFHPADATE